MSSVRHIAKLAGVSPATVSRALNNNPKVEERVRERILSLANRARYLPSVGKRSTTNVAVAYTGVSSLGSPFDAALMQGMALQMEPLGLDLIVLEIQRAKLPEESMSQMFFRKGIRGAVLRTTAATRHLCEELAAEGFPSLVVGDRFDSPRVHSIYSDSHSSSKLAVEHLISLGHRRIAVVTNVVDDSDHADRLAAHRAALEAHGLTWHPSLLYRVPAEREDGVQLIRQLASGSNRPTAIFFADPMPAIGAIHEAHRLGLRLPGDLSIIGFDDSQLRHLVHPQMTAVCQDAVELGRSAIACLSELLSREGRGPAIRRVLPTRFEVHGTTGRPR